MDDLEKNVNEIESELERPEMVLFLEKMQDANQVMVSDNTIYLI